MAITVSNDPIVSISGAVGGTPADLFIRDVSKWMKKTRRTDTPLFNLIKKGPPAEIPAMKREWGQSYPHPDNDTLAAAIVGAGDATMTVTNPDYWQENMFFQIDAEILQTTTEVGAGVWNILRGRQGTAAAAHVNGAVALFLTNGYVEHQVTKRTPVVQGDVDYNVHQQMEYMHELSFLAGQIPTYETLRSGGKDRLRWLAKKLMGEKAPLDIDRALHHQFRTTGTTVIPPTFGGILQASYTATRNTTLSGPLTERILMDNLQTVHNLVGAEGMGKTILAPPQVIRIISSWYKNLRRATANEKRVSNYVAEIDTMFGVFKLVPDYNWRKPVGTTLVPHNGLMIANFDDFSFSPLSDASRWHLVFQGEQVLDAWVERAYLRGVYTLTAENPYSRLYLEGFSTDAADYPGMA